ncbi:MAG: hypothetical protein KTR31_00980 [Myxococcales bacterium]|nr:hypothetical protein [Myxococcales bacterium]
MNRRTIAGLAVIAVIVAGLALFALGPQDTEPDVPEPVERPETKQDREVVKAYPRAKPIPLPRPPDIEVPEPLEDRPSPVDIGHEEKLEMNYAVDDVLKEARDSCIVEWIDGIADPTEAEFVFDAVLVDGRLSDVTMRSLNLEMPQTVADCIRDAAWYADWPTWDLEGELRLQRQISYRNAAAMPPPP